jgi:hypothetical protein
MRVLSCCGRVPDMRAQACCTPRIAAAMRGNGESIVNIRVAMLRGAGMGDRSVSTAAAYVALPTINALPPDGKIALHFTETALHLLNTTLHFTEDTLIAAETTLHSSNAPLHCSKGSLFLANAAMHCPEASLLFPETSLHASDAALLCEKASLFRTWASGSGQRAPTRMAYPPTPCVMRGRRSARMTGSHSKVPSPHWRSTVFK